MRDVRVAAAQFEHRDGDKAWNLARIRELAGRAAAQGAEMVCFHECSVTGYTYLRRLEREALSRLAEPVPGGPATAALIETARELGLVVTAGLIGFRKLHPFISPHLSPGEGHHVADLRGLRAGFLICYDNNLPENVRATALLGADVIFAPHVTGGTPSSMPGRGPIEATLWERRHQDPEALRREFDGLKGRAWLMRWLPARAWENGVYIVFSNAVGRDDDTIKPGLAMVLDPFGEVQAESRALGDDVVVTELRAEKRERAPGRRYLRARRPELYAKLVEPHPAGQEAVTEPGWTVDSS